MDWAEGKQTVIAVIRKYRWAVLVLVLGLLMMGFSQEPHQEHRENTPVTQQPEELSLQQELEKLLMQMEGAGKVSVLLTSAHGPEYHFQVDEDGLTTVDSTDQRKDTVLVTQSDRSQTGLIRRVDSPVYLGAVVLCQGGDDPRLRLAIVDAVGTATGLTSDKISVWKMK